MLTGSQRSYLKSLSHDMNPLIQLGKSGLNEGFLNQLDQLLDDHELVKITFLQNSPVEINEVVDDILDKTGAEFVQSIGKKLTIYRRSEENPKIILK